MLKELRFDSRSRWEFTKRSDAGKRWTENLLSLFFLKRTYENGEENEKDLTFRLKVFKIGTKFHYGPSGQLVIVLVWSICRA